MPYARGGGASHRARKGLGAVRVCVCVRACVCVCARACVAAGGRGAHAEQKPIAIMAPSRTVLVQSRTALAVARQHVPCRTSRVHGTPGAVYMAKGGRQGARRPCTPCGCVAATVPGQVFPRHGVLGATRPLAGGRFGAGCQAHMFRCGHQSFVHLGGPPSLPARHGAQGRFAHGFWPYILGSRELFYLRITQIL